MIGALHLSELISQETDRPERLSLALEGITIDISKNPVTEETVSLLLALADECRLDEKRNRLFQGEAVNITENRAALHMLLRAPRHSSLFAAAPALATPIHKELKRLYQFVHHLRNGAVKGANGKPIGKMINIGIGGSDLGPRLVVEALSEFHDAPLEMDFIANIDPFEMEQVLQRSNPEATLFVVASKSFTTQETLSNANRAKEWLEEKGCCDIRKHFITVSENVAAARQFGVDEGYCYRIWDWVGGRYSVWSSMGLIIAASIGEAHFKRFLAGAHTVDRHFQSTALNRNIPVILGLLGIWNNNFLGMKTHAIIPYDHRLQKLPAYLCQLVMESNGKSVTADGEQSGVDTSPVIWGGTGSNAQHAFFQFLHQGTHQSSIDFLLPLHCRYDDARHQMLVANCIAQGEALLRGVTNLAEPHRHFAGGRPSTTFLYERLDPYTLGMLLAIYEHKTFVEASIWGINPFDQWGVELGKALTAQILEELGSHEVTGSHDPSTEFLMRKYLSMKG